jgi:hypothetical protein
VRQEQRGRERGEERQEEGGARHGCGKVGGQQRRGALGFVWRTETTNNERRAGETST